MEQDEEVEEDRINSNEDEINTEEENGEICLSSANETGIIQKIELINFMCHSYIISFLNYINFIFSHLELELSPRVNFLIGSNGSMFEIEYMTEG